MYTQHLTCTHISLNRSYKELIGCVVEEDDTFVDADWMLLRQVKTLTYCVHILSHTRTPKQVKTVEPVEDFPNGWRSGSLYQLRADPKRVCLYFGDDEYEGLDADSPYTFVDGVIRDGDGDEVKLMDSSDVAVVIGRTDSAVDSSKTPVVDELFDPELQELEEDGGGYLSDSDGDNGIDFLFGGDGDKKIVKL